MSHSKITADFSTKIANFRIWESSSVNLVVRIALINWAIMINHHLGRIIWINLCCIRDMDMNMWVGQIFSEVELVGDTNTEVTKNRNSNGKV